MDSLIKADIFFFVTTIAVIVVSIVLVAAIIYVARILRRAEKVADRVGEEINATADDIADLRGELREQGLARFAWRAFSPQPKTRNKTKAKVASEKTKK